MTRERDSGVVLINVLVILGLAATVVYVMLTLADVSIARSQRFGEAAQGLALIRGGEQSAIAALRRDMIEASDTDNAAEPWNDVGQETIEIPGGTFELEIADAQGLFNLNTLVGGGLQGEEVLNALGEAADLPPQVVPRILSSLELDGPLRRLEDLTGRVGLTAREVAKLGQLATALPGKGEVNINAAPVELLSLLLDNPAQAQFLVNRRDRAGFLTPRDLEAARVLLPPGVGYSSNLFRVRTTVQIGDTVQSVESLLRRREGPDGPEVAVIERRSPIAAEVPPPRSS